MNGDDKMSDPTAEFTIDISPATTPGWIVKVKVTVMGKPVGLNEAEVTLTETTWWQPFKKTYGPVKTDSSGVASFANVAGAYYLFGVKIDNIYYDAVAKLLVKKDPFPAGTTAKKGFRLEDGTWSDPGEVVCEVCGEGITLGPYTVLTCPRCRTTYVRG